MNRSFRPHNSRVLMMTAVAASALCLAAATAAESTDATSVTAPNTAPHTPPESLNEQPGAGKPLDASVEKLACEATLDKTVRPAHKERLNSFCAQPRRLPSCLSHEAKPIHHQDYVGQEIRGRRILVLGLIHGDEPLAGEMALDWAERLTKITGARNSWRVVPMLNPDGLEKKTRMNVRGVDLNRNFPTKDWEDAAIAYWKKNGKEDPRRYPGEGPASEAETKCVIAHIKDFKPDFIVAVHTPYKVLDFDGPKMPFPPYKDLPWRALGNFPGSLGRYMWKDYQIPVLTVELGESMVDAGRLQDIVGTFAIEASRRSGQKTASTFERL